MQGKFFLGELLRRKNFYFNEDIRERVESWFWLLYSGRRYFVLQLAVHGIMFSGNMFGIMETMYLYTGGNFIYINGLFYSIVYDIWYWQNNILDNCVTEQEKRI